MTDSQLKRGQPVTVDYREGDDEDSHYLGAATFWKAVTAKDCARRRSPRSALASLPEDARVLVQLPGIAGTVEFPARCVRAA